jgi:predicted GTPase
LLQNQEEELESLLNNFKMIIYNVTCSVDKDILNDWMQWMKSEHIPELMQCGCFVKAHINKVITQADTNTTIAIAYYCNSMSDLHRYQVKFSNIFQEKHRSKYGKHVEAFRTILEEIDEFNI